MISLLAKNVKQTLAKALPNTLIQEEHYVNYKGQRLFFDFYVPTLSLCIEVQGVQHTEFNEHFHGDAVKFNASKKRDKLKEEWCYLNDYTLVSIDFSEIPLEPAQLLHKIEEAQNSGREH